MLLLAFGCGQPVEITYHYDTPAADLEQMSGVPGTGGFARWRTEYDTQDLAHGDASGHKQCDIWLLSKEKLPGTCWSLVIAHEQRHCYEGDFHPKTMHGGDLICDAEGVTDEIQTSETNTAGV